jgi:hypothetical protein
MGFQIGYWRTTTPNLQAVPSRTISRNSESKYASHQYPILRATGKSRGPMGSCSKGSKHVYTIGSWPTIHVGLRSSFCSMGHSYHSDCTDQRDPFLPRVRIWSHAPFRVTLPVHTSQGVLRWGLGQQANRRCQPTRGALWTSCTPSSRIPTSLTSLQREACSSPHTWHRRLCPLTSLKSNMVK